MQHGGQGELNAADAKVHVLNLAVGGDGSNHDYQTSYAIIRKLIIPLNCVKTESGEEHSIQRTKL